MLWGGQHEWDHHISNDLRARVVSAIVGGFSRRTSAAKFSVSIVSAVRWHQRLKRTGNVAPSLLGGDRLSHKAEAHASLVLFWIDRQADLTIREICGRLCQQGHSFSLSKDPASD